VQAAHHVRQRDLRGPLTEALSRRLLVSSDWRADWTRVLDADRRGAIDAPGWLWESVVALSGLHEAGYLNHCRQYAMGA